MDDIMVGPYVLGPNDINQGIYEGDARILSEQIPDESIDLILCDPVYQNLDDYRWLAEIGKRILKPGGNLVAQAAHYYLPDLYPIMGKYLDFVWPMVELLAEGTSACLYKHKIVVRHKPYLWYSKDRRSGAWVFDVIRGGGRTKKHHAWGDSPELFLELTLRLSGKDGIVFDPFTGGAVVPAACKMVGVRWLAFEMDKLTADKARDRIQNTEMPIFKLGYEQLIMQIGDE